MNLRLVGCDQQECVGLPRDGPNEVAPLFSFLLRMLSARNLLLAALGCFVLYFVALHPWSGSLGGIVFWMLGSSLPTVFIVLLALGLAFLLPAPLLVRLPVALVLSFLFGINAALPDLPGLHRYENVASGQVRAKVPPVATWRQAIHVKRRPWPPLFTRPLVPQLRVGADEGCMCMYFLETSIYSDLVEASLLRVSGRRTSVVNYRDPAQESQDVHLDVRFWQNDTEYSARIEIVDHGKPVARFDQRKIPLTAVVERKGVGREKFGENFWENAVHLFARDNAWSYIVDRIAPNYYPGWQVEEFFREAGAGT